MGMGRILPLRRVQGEVAEMSDEALLAACALPDAAALGALFDRFAPAVSKFLMRFLGSAHAEIDDIDNVLGRSTSQLLSDQLCCGAGPRHGLGISYDNDSHHCSERGENVRHRFSG